MMKLIVFSFMEIYDEAIINITVVAFFDWRNERMTDKDYL